MVNAQTWLENIPNWKTAKVIYGTKDHLKQQVLGGANIQELDGDLTIDGLGDLEELNLVKTGKLDNVTISNCPNLKIINLGDSGVKHLKLGPGLDGLLRLDISVDLITDSSRKLNELDLSHVSNLKVLKCHGELTTKLIGFEKLVQLQHFDTTSVLDAKNVILIPTKEFSKWKKNLDIITDHNNGLDLLKGGSGSDKDDVDPTKLNNYKNPPASKPDVPITKDQWDNDYSKRPTKEEFEKIKKLHESIKNAAERKIGSDWKNFLDIERYYNQIEQSSK